MAKTKKLGDPKVKTTRKIEKGFVVDDDGLVDVCLELEFKEDLTVKVSPEVAERLCAGEFNWADPGDHDRELNIDIDDLVNLRMEISGAYEARPLTDEERKVSSG